MGEIVQSQLKKKRGGTSRSTLWSLAFESITGALLSLYITTSLGVIAEHGITSTDPFAQSVAIALGNALAIVVMGLCSPTAGKTALLRCGFLGVALCLILEAGSFFLPTTSLQLAYVVCRSVTAGLLVIGWCEYLGSKSNPEKGWVLAATSLLFSLFVLCLFFVDLSIGSSVTEVLLLVAAWLAVRSFASKRTESTVDTQGQTPEGIGSLLVKISFLFFSLVMMAFLFAFAYINKSVSSQFSFSIWENLAPMWFIVLSVSVIALFWLFARKPTLSFPVMAIPLLSLVFFFPFAFSSDIYRASLSVSALFQICFLIICSASIPNTHRVIVLGPIRFVAWTRSLMTVGGIPGILLGTYAAGLLGSKNAADMLVWAFLLCGIICISVATLFGFQEVTAPPLPKTSRASLDSICEALAQTYSLTKRETEVFSLLAQGRGVPFVQKALYISAGTADSHVKHIYQKLGVHSREELLDLVHAEPDA